MSLSITSKTAEVGTTKSEALKEYLKGIEDDKLAMMYGSGYTHGYRQAVDDLMYVVEGTLRHYLGYNEELIHRIMADVVAQGKTMVEMTRLVMREAAIGYGFEKEFDGFCKGLVEGDDTYQAFEKLYNSTTDAALLAGAEGLLPQLLTLANSSAIVPSRGQNMPSCVWFEISKLVVEFEHLFMIGVKKGLIKKDSRGMSLVDGFGDKLRNIVKAHQRLNDKPQYRLVSEVFTDNQVYPKCSGKMVTFQFIRHDGQIAYRFSTTGESGPFGNPLNINPSVMKKWKAFKNGEVTMKDLEDIHKTTKRANTPPMTAFIVAMAAQKLEVGTVSDCQSSLDLINGKVKQLLGLLSG